MTSSQKLPEVLSNGAFVNVVIGNTSESNKWERLWIVVDHSQLVFWGLPEDKETNSSPPKLTLPLDGSVLKVVKLNAETTPLEDEQQQQQQQATTTTSAASTTRLAVQISSKVNGIVLCFIAPDPSHADAILKGFRELVRLVPGVSRPLPSTPTAQHKITSSTQKEKPKDKAKEEQQTTAAATTKEQEKQSGAPKGGTLPLMPVVVTATSGTNSMRQGGLSSPREPFRGTSNSTSPVPKRLSRQWKTAPLAAMLAAQQATESKNQQQTKQNTKPKLITTTTTTPIKPPQQTQKPIVVKPVAASNPIPKTQSQTTTQNKPITTKPVTTTTQTKQTSGNVNANLSHSQPQTTQAQTTTTTTIAPSNAVKPTTTNQPHSTLHQRTMSAQPTSTQNQAQQPKLSISSGTVSAITIPTNSTQKSPLTQKPTIVHKQTTPPTTTTTNKPQPQPQTQQQGRVLPKAPVNNSTTNTNTTSVRPQPQPPKLVSRQTAPNLTALSNKIQSSTSASITPTDQKKQPTTTTTTTKTATTTVIATKSNSPQTQTPPVSVSPPLIPSISQQQAVTLTTTENTESKQNQDQTKSTEEQTTLKPNTNPIEPSSILIPEVPSSPIKEPQKEPQPQQPIIEPPKEQQQQQPQQQAIPIILPPESIQEVSQLQTFETEEGIILTTSGTNQNQNQPKGRPRRAKIINTATSRTASAQALKRVPKAFFLPPLDTISTVDLTYNRLTKFPEELFAMPVLENLNLNGNRISSIPEGILKLDKLKVLLMSVNSLQELPSYVFKLQNLTELQVEHCSIASISIPTDLTLTSLELFNLGFNDLTEIPDSFSLLRHLIRVDLSNNKLQTLPTSIGDLSQLVEFHIPNNRITTLPSELSRLHSLEVFELASNQIKELPSTWNTQEAIGSFASMTELYMQKNAIKELPETFFSLFGPRIQLIDVAENKIEKVPSLDSVPNLAALFLGGNRIKTLPTTFPTKVLACLDISRNLLEELPDFSYLVEIQTLHAGFNPLTKCVISMISPTVVELVLPGLNIESLPSCDFPNLEILDIALNKIKEIPDGWIKYSKLRVCDISFNQLPSIPSPFTDETREIDLHMDGNLYTNPSNKSFRNLEKCNPKLSIGIAETQGRRDSMEDSTAIHCNFLNGKYDAVVTLFDGHGGSKYSEACSRIFVEHFSAITHFTEGLKTIKEQLCDSFKSTDEAAFDEVREELQGTTALVGIFDVSKEPKLHVANVGDTRAVLCRAGEAIRLSKDHKSLDPEEYIRVSEAGGFVTERGRVQGVLAVSRSLGDLLLQPIVSNEPLYQEINISDRDEFVIFACDGVWDTVSDSMAVTIVKEALVQFDGNPSKAALKLRDWAFLSGSGDNISCIVVVFKH